MRRILLFGLIFISACTRQQKAERLVKHLLDSTLNDPHSYEAVSTKIDTFWNSKYREQLKAAILKGGDLDSVKTDTSKNFQDGWYVTHTYRAKNSFGALGLHKIEVHEDKNFTKIIEVLSSN